MKKIGEIILGTWCVATSLLSPLWLSLIFINITGLIYKYDATYDEGVAGIIGVVGLMLWIFIVLLPNILLLQNLKNAKRKKMLIFLWGVMILFAIICTASCGKWLTYPVT